MNNSEAPVIPSITGKEVFAKIMDTTPENIAGYVKGTQFEGDGDIGQPIGVAGAVILGMALVAGVYMLFQTL